jgi:hypothetical protein
MDRVTKFFIQNFVKFAGVISDKGMLIESGIMFDDLVIKADQYGYECIDLGDNFVVADSWYCN